MNATEQMTGDNVDTIVEETLADMFDFRVGQAGNGGVHINDDLQADSLDEVDLRLRLEEGIGGLDLRNVRVSLTNMKVDELKAHIRALLVSAG